MSDLITSFLPHSTRFERYLQMNSVPIARSEAFTPFVSVSFSLPYNKKKVCKSRQEFSVPTFVFKSLEG